MVLSSKDRDELLLDRSACYPLFSRLPSRDTYSPPELQPEVEPPHPQSGSATCPPGMWRPRDFPRFLLVLTGFKLGLEHNN